MASWHRFFFFFSRSKLPRDFLMLWKAESRRTEKTFVAVLRRLCFGCRNVSLDWRWTFEVTTSAPPYVFLFYLMLIHRAAWKRGVNLTHLFLPSTIHILAFLSTIFMMFLVTEAQRRNELFESCVRANGNFDYSRMARRDNKVVAQIIGGVEIWLSLMDQNWLSAVDD